MPSEDDLLDPALAMSKAARDRWNRERRLRNAAIMSDLESGLLARQLQRELGAIDADLQDGQELERWRIELLGSLNRVRRNQT